MKISKTYIPKEGELERQNFIIDAQGKILGKVATRAATILRGKDRTTFTPHLDCGNNVIIINAQKVKVTGKKMQQKVYSRYSGYPSGQKTMTLEQMLNKAPCKVLRLAVNRMIPSGKLGNQVRSRLRIYSGDKHPHAGQKPIAVEL